MNDANLSKWQILKWANAPENPASEFVLPCPECGIESWLPTAPISARLAGHTEDGRPVFEPGSFTPPQNWLPDHTCCPHCGLEVVSDLRESERSLAELGPDDPFTITLLHIDEKEQP